MDKKDIDGKSEKQGSTIWTVGSQRQAAGTAVNGATPADAQAEPRRTFLKGVGLVSLGLLCCRSMDAMASTPPTEVWMPQEGDLLSSSDTAKALTIENIPEASDPLTAFPFDPKVMEVRDRRFAGILLLKFKDAELAPHMSSVAAGGVLAYSQVCVHAGCVVTAWQAATQTYFCGCHGSMFSPLEDGAVAGGPAPRPLPNLPLKLASDGKTLVVAGPFSAAIGPRSK